MKTYKVGRSAKNSDIVLSNMTLQVSRVHLEFVDMENGKYYINDLSSAGVKIFNNGQWSQIKQSYVNTNTRLMLADYETTVQAILNAVPQEVKQEISQKMPSNSVSRSKGVYTGKVERNPETGEIIRR